VGTPAYLVSHHWMVHRRPVAILATWESETASGAIAATARIFAAEQWRIAGFSPDLAERVSRVLAERMRLPNHYFLPDDPISLLLLDEEGMGRFEARFALRRSFGADLKPGAIVAMGLFQELVAQIPDHLTAE